MRRRISESIRSPRGFTLLELMIVLSLIVLLASIGLMQYNSTVQRGREAVLAENLYRMRDAIDQFHVDKGKYPADISELVSAGYLRSIPLDPMTNSAESWQLIPAEPDPSNPTADIGIYDIKSGSEAVGLDGRKYADW